MSYLTHTPENKTRQTFLTQYTEKPYFEWEENKFVEEERGIYKQTHSETGLAGIAQFIYENGLDVKGWFAIITEGITLIWHHCTMPNLEYLKENDWRDENTYNQRCPFAEYFERRGKR
ncbi:MAG: hypothetical protein ACTSVO_00730 [Candidatus Heimdallarchaeaceae archaeon]